MRLGVNGWRLVGVRTGVGRYLFNLVSCWSPKRVAGRFEEINLYSQSPLHDELPAGIQRCVIGPPWRMLVWENLRLGPKVADDIVYHPSFSIPLLRRGKSVVVIHEAVHEDYPHLFPRSVTLFYRHLYRWSARHATLVISGSETAKRDVARTMTLPLDKIRVVPMAPASFFRMPPAREVLEAVLRQFSLESFPYFLFVGKLSGRRSIPLLLEGFADFKRRSAMPHKLVMVGPNIHKIDVADMLAALQVAGEVVYLGFVGDEELNALYHAATALVSPAVYEPISLPVMEAQAAGTPVVCTDSAGMRETTAGHAILLPRLGREELAGALIRLAQEPEWGREIATRAQAHSAGFSWERSATLTLDILAEVARG